MILSTTIYKLIHNLTNQHSNTRYNMILTTFHKNTTDDLLDFIIFWSKQYSFSNEDVYRNAISKKEFTLADIQNLYVWKNGMKLSELKQKSLLLMLYKKEY